MNEPMTDYQFKTLLKMILDILESSSTVEEAKQKVLAYIEENAQK